MTTLNTTAIASDRRLQIDMAEDIAHLVPEVAPFTAIIKRAAKEKAISHKFEWLERELDPREDAINNGAGYNDSATSVVVDNGSYFKAGQIVKIPRTAEVFLVTAVSTNTLTITRGYGETTAAAIVDNDPLVIIGNVNQEGAAAPATSTGSPTPVYNFTQIFRHAFDVTNTANACKTYGGKLILQEQAQQSKMHMIDIERSFLYGERKEDTNGTNPQRSTRGLLKFLTENIKSSAGNLTELAFNTWLQDVFMYGSQKKLLIASPLLVSVISTWAGGKLVTNSGASAKYGIAVTTYTSPHGELNIVKQPLFKGTVYGGYGMALDMQYVKYRFLEGRDTTLKTNIQNNNVDGREDEYLTECGLQLMLPKAHGVISGVTGAA